MSKWFREPLIHFLLLGLLIFMAYEVVAGKGSENYQLIGDSSIEFSDAAVARRALGVAA